MFKVACIYSEYPDIVEAAEDIVKRTGWQIEFGTAVFDQAVKLAKEYEKKGFDLIISRGVSGSLIKKSLNIPVVLIEITTFDILQTLYEARQYGSRIGFFQFFNHRSSWDFDTIKKVLGMKDNELHIYYYQNEQELKKQIKIAYSGGLDVVVATGSYVLELIRPYGRNTVMVRSTKESIYNAFKEAEDILHVRSRDKMLLQYKGALLASMCGGYLLLDDKDEVIHADEAISRLGAQRGLPGLSWVGKNGAALMKVLDEIPDHQMVSVDGQRMHIRKKSLHHNQLSIGRAVCLTYPEERELLTNTGKSKREINDGQNSQYSFSDIIGTSPLMSKAVSNAKIYAKTESNILITGESGTGKEVFAQSIHAHSPRKNGPFIAVNCATLPHSLLESELFGYEEGAFTGAKKGGSRGLFEIAGKGTLFLDEISEITLADQAQLLRVLQEKTIRRIGGKKTIPVDARVIAATNVNLMEKVKSGQFRLDLFYRLNILNLHLPPLRERKEDIPLLVGYFMSKQEQYCDIPGLLMEKFVNYPWPGNVRELANFVEKFVILSLNNKNAFQIVEELYSEFSATPETSRQDRPDDSITVKLDTMKKMELEIIRHLYETLGKDRTKLATVLDISRTNLWMKLNEIYPKE